jgi:hypothetical protein
MFKDYTPLEWCSILRVNGQEVLLPVESLDKN